jgi:hypothetical protein
MAASLTGISPDVPPWFKLLSHQGEHRPLAAADAHLPVAGRDGTSFDGR